MLNHALKAFDFLKIRYPNSSDNLNSLLYILPAFFSLLICLFFGIIDFNIKNGLNIFNHKAFDNVSTFVQILPGFYIGSLAAIASYNSRTMDNKMPHPTPYLEEVLSNGIRHSELSRRRYLTLLFGYLSALSILTAIFIFFVRLAYDVNLFKVNVTLYNFIYYSLTFIFFFYFCQMVLITMFGIYYLADRIHRN